MLLVRVGIYVNADQCQQFTCCFHNISLFQLVSGKKGEEKIRQYASKSTTFSGYLLRLKGSTWKTRWCVVKENTLFCYKDFGVGATELEIPLPGKSVQCIAEGNLKQPFVFVIGAEKESFSFAAENDAELEEWMMVLTDEIKPEAEGWCIARVIMHLSFVTSRRIRAPLCLRTIIKSKTSNEALLEKTMVLHYTQ